MWELLLGFPRGRMSTRNFIMLLATFFVVAFGYLLFGSTSVYAASDATWKDDKTILYDGRTYQGPIVKKSSDKLPGVPDGAVVFVDLIKDQKKGSVIFFDPSESESYLNNSTSATLINYDTYTGGESGLPEFSDPSSPEEISIAPRAPPENTQTTTSCDSDALQGIGWIVCPVTQSIARGMDYIYSAISVFLKVPPLVTSDATGQTMYRVWDFSRNLANVAFIIAVLIMIYAQVTGGGMTNYTLKKLLPRLIIAAVLVNLSFWICAICIDVTNILGNSVQELFINMRQSIVVKGETFKPISASELASWLLGGGTAAAAGGIALYVGGTALTTAAVGGGAIFIFIPMLISLAFVVLVTFLILAARQAIITLFVILSPFALVAYILPNTEKWFGKWRDTLIKLLFIYPAFSAIFGGAQLAAALIINTAQEANSFLLVLLAWGVQVAPLAITPLLLRLGGGVLNRFANIVNDPAKGVFDRGKAWANENRDAAVARGQRRLAGRNNTGTMSRFGAQRTAYNRMYRKQRREGEKSANEALTKGYFTQTAAGRDIHRLGERAKLEQGYGDNQNQASWENEVRRDAYLRNRAIGSHDAHSRAELYKQDVDSEANEHWQHTLRHDAALRTIKTDSHLAQGRAKLTEEYLNAQDERTLQTQIASTAHLRDTKIQTDISTAHAKLQADSVASEAKMLFRDEVLTSHVLRTTVADTVAFEKAATIAENIVQKQAERQWDDFSRTDQATQRLRLQEEEATDEAKMAEVEWNKLVEQARASGLSAGLVSSTNRDVARSLQDTAVLTSAHQSAVENLKDDQKSLILNRLNNRPELLEVAGGGTKYGPTKVLAKAQSGITKEVLENAKAMTSIYSNAGYRVDELFKAMDKEGGVLRDNEPADDVAKLAAIQYVMEDIGNNWAVEKTVDRMIRDYGMEMVTDDEGNATYYDARAYREAMRSGTDLPAALSEKEVGGRRDMLQMVVGGYRNSKNKVSWLSNTMLESLNRGISNISYRDEAAVGRELTASEAAILKEARQGKYDGGRMAKMDPDELARMIQSLRDPNFRAALTETERARIVDGIVTAQSSDQTRHLIKPRERGLMNIAASYLELGDEANPSEEELLQLENVYYEVQMTDAAGVPYKVRVPEGTPGATEVWSAMAAPNIYDMDRQDDIAPSGIGRYRPHERPRTPNGDEPEDDE